MVSFGGVAKLLRSFECSASSWVKVVNPGWYEAREIPKTILIQKVQHVPQNTRVIRQRPQTAEPPKKSTSQKRQLNL
ncbi:uncharacterized protein LOC6735161 [Drosophila simulans]|uniref:GD11402 n=1 Tax=Drosophila simulans TaxID=7240 RepID=B4QD16_DROSI|nr:uncharacterized protein LOC6735161 [Drosophila simulans]XP_044778680.1 uncharacterized protein LOC6735161 [Drosophila simulans]EDX07721.1 GD11402 [Drosophila simulans]KMY94917.1 uncharacterized protein Dsimw501_GD11402 [Drosophila simulans]